MGRGVRADLNAGFPGPLSQRPKKPDTAHVASGEILFALGMPVAMAVSGIAAWRMSKKEGGKPETPQWRDDSLDDWRKERDAQAELQRTQRPAESHLKTGQEEQVEVTKKHQRIGG